MFDYLHSLYAIFKEKKNNATILILSSLIEQENLAGNVMIQQAGERELLIYTALHNLQTGLNKIIFEEEHSKKIIDALLSSIMRAEDSRQERDLEKRKQRLMTEGIFIQALLNNIILNKKISHPEAENYFFEATKIFNHLLSTECKSIPDIDSFSSITARLSEKIIVKDIFEINKSHKSGNSLLENKMGYSNFEESYRDKIISSAIGSGEWLEQQIYRLAFDHFYTHCIQLYDISRKIDALSLSEKNEDAAKKRKIKLFERMNLSALNSPDAQRYLNNLAMSLGFNDLQALYENFHHLNLQKNYEVYCKKKIDFFENEEMRKSIKIISEEFERVQTLTDTDSSAYKTIIDAIGKDYLKGQASCQNAKKIAMTFTGNYFINNIMPDEKKHKDAAIARTKYDLRLKNLLHEKFLFIMSNESIIEERRINDIAYQLNKEWLELRKAQTENDRKDYNEILEKVNTSSDEIIFQYYLASEEAQSDAFNHYKKALKDNPNDLHAREKENLDLYTKEYKNYKNAIQYKILNQVLNKKEINNFIEEKNKKISEANKKIKFLREQIAQNTKALSDFEKNSKSLFGFITNTKDLFFSIFGYKSSHLREKEKHINEIQKNIYAFRRECSAAERAFTFHHLSKKTTEEQLSTYSLITDLTIKALKSELTQRINEYIETHKKIIACYTQSNPHEYIGEKLHALEIEYIKTKEISQFTCDLLIEKLSLSNAPHNIEDFSEANIFEIEKTYQTLKEQKIKIAGFDTIEKELLESIDNLLPLLKSAIEKSIDFFQKEKMPKYREKIITHIENREPEILEDPFEGALKKIIQKDIVSFSRLNAILCDEIQKIYCDFLERNEPTIELLELENIELQLQKKYYYYNINPEKDAQSNAYKKIIKKINDCIDKKYEKISSSPFEIIRDNLISLDCNFIKSYRNQVYFHKEKKSVFKAYELFLVELFGYAPPTSIIRDVEISDLAHTKALHNFLERYLKILKSYEKNLFSSWTLLNSNVLDAHAGRIKKEYLAIQEELINQKGDLPPIVYKTIATQNEILNFLKNRQKGGPKQNFSELKNNRRKILRKIKALKSFSKKIESKIIKEYIFEEDSFMHFSLLLDEIKNEVNASKENLVAIEKGYNLKNSTQSNWINQKIIFENTIEYAQSIIDKIEKNEYRSFELYSKINLNAVNDIYFDNPKYYGIALLLAIKKEDYPLAYKLIAEHGVEIHIQHLADGLTLALKNNQQPLFIKIVEARKDISFSNATLLNIISTSVILDRLNFTIPILFDSDFELDKNTSDLLRNSALTKKSSLAPVKKNILQLFFDQDASFLEGLRQCYAIEYSLLFSLEAEYNALKLQSSVDDVELVTFYNKMDKTAIIGQNLLHFYLDFNEFENINVDRKAQHVKTWSSQIQELRTRYTNGLPNSIKSALYLNDLIRIKQDIINTIDNTENTNEVFLYLENIKNFFKSKNSDKFLHMLSESIIHAVNHDRLEALDVLLSYLEEPRLKKELTYNAFCQAISSLRPNCLKHLLRIEAYQYDKNDALLQISRLYYSTKDNYSYSEKVLAKSLLIESLTYIPMQFDPLISDLINYLSQIDDTKIQKSAYRDDPILEKIRSVYIFCEQAYHHIYDIHSDFRNPFENLLTDADNDASKIKPSVIANFAERAILHKAYATHQTKVVRKLKKNAIKHILEHHSIQGSIHQQSQIAIWDDNLKTIANTCIENFNSDLEFVSNEIEKYDRNSLSTLPYAAKNVST